MSVPSKVIELVERFENNIEAYKSGQYNETQVRREFIDPFFSELGWDVDNRRGYAEAYKDVVHEDSIKIDQSTKAPDYCFRVGGARKFFLEAKKPSVDIKGDIHPAYQLRRYAWSARLPLSILTDFEEFAVYDCRIKPMHTDSAATARVLYITFREYAERWDDLYALYSREAVLKGSFDRYADSTDRKKGTAGVDEAFLREIESWREALARNIALRNPSLSTRELNFAVQRTIDRLIFLRICEDRGIEPYGQLMQLPNGPRVYPRLVELFRRADARYNSGIFHFENEKGQSEEPDLLTPALTVDDPPLRDIIKSLYYPESPYEFSVLPAEILGQVYEQFLGKVIRLTAGHRAQVEDKPEVKKAGGVFYTPSYIVDYIVKHTLGTLLEGKTIDHVRGTRGGAPVRVLDPACGSGSFLIVAYQVLLDWYRERYEEDDPEKHAKGKSPVLYRSPGGWRLTTREKRRILLDHIYGVDIDPQAVEVTKLSLALKVLENESEQTLTSQLSLFRERALPDLGANIKCGNSLIGPDFYEDTQLSLLDDEERYRVNVFDWEREFPFIGAGGGFDAVIGNPPYIRQEGLGEFKDYFARTYEVYHGVADIYAYFIEKAIKLTRRDGYFSYIVANKWLRANYGEPLRRWLKARNIVEIVDFGDLPVFQRATTYPCIIRLRGMRKPARDFRAVRVGTLEFADLSSYVGEHAHTVAVDSLDDAGWSLADERSQALLEKIKAAGVPLGTYVEGKIYYGIKTGYNEAFVIDEETCRRLVEEDPKSAEVIKPFLVGKDIKRYAYGIQGRYLILIPKGWTREKLRGERDAFKCLEKHYPAIARHFAPHEKAAAKRYDKGEYWWELRACDYYGEFEKPKILWPEIAGSARFTFDTEDYYANNKVFIIPGEDRYLLGLLNSSLLRVFIHSACTDLQGNSFNFSGVFLARTPIRPIDFDDPADRDRHDRMVALVELMLSLHRELADAREPHQRTALQRQIESTDARIDALVYELYGLTDEEIAVVEGEGRD